MKIEISSYAIENFITNVCACTMMAAILFVAYRAQYPVDQVTVARCASYPAHSEVRCALMTPAMWRQLDEEFANE